MLESVKISRRQSEIRQSLAELVGKEKPTEDEVRSLENLDTEYRTNEKRFRASLIAEDEERKAANDDFETRSEKEWSDLMGGFELRQVALALDEGAALSGQTAEIVQEMRSKGGYRGIPVPYAALETRTGETVASGTPDPKMTAPIIDRIFAQSVTGRMGARVVNINSGLQEFPVVTSSVAAGWAATETGSVAGPTVYATTDRPLAPDHTLGITMKITRKSLKQSGDALEAAVRRDMSGAITEAVDRATFTGSGSDGEPTGIIALASGVGITETNVSALASYAVFKAAARRAMDRNTAMKPSAMRWLIRPLTYSILDGTVLTGTSDAEWDRLIRRFGEGAFTISDNALPDSEAEDGTDKGKHTIITTALTGGTAPIFVGMWGGVDVIRDPYSDAASGGLRLTGLATMDVTISRVAQIEILNNVQDRA
ncbi:phage major capsid protein [Hyphococcus sp.]|uniref:phage major capsid protein n=1 Tax=Hyphococcus sp. TaxID=2038636 RepID=UPI002086C78E|nr:MAG: major capsid protein [Marinicaulis sp.]